MMKRYRAPLLVAAGLFLWPGTGAAAPGDIVFERAAGAAGAAGIPAAIFPHWVHRVRYRCSVCHPKIFEMKLGANPITMDAIGKGQFCGQCHNGRTSFQVDFQNCTRCHKEPAE